MKILIHSNAPFACTGYGVQTALLAPRLRDLGHDVAISCFYGVEGAMLDWNGIPLYPTDHTRFGKAMLSYYVGHFAGDDVDPREVLVLTLMDVWALTHDRLRELRLASWTPVDHDPLPPRVLDYFQKSGARAIAMSKFGRDRLAAAGVDSVYVPHGVDTTVYVPTPDRAACRRALRIPDDAYVVGMVANNKGQAPPRKAFPEVFAAFAEFHERHPESILYLHSDVFGFDAGINLIALAKVCGIPDEALATTDQLGIQLGTPPEIMASVYGAFDVLASPSYGEGFGVPIVEAQACGIPVIATDWTAMTELVPDGNGWLVGGDVFYDPPHGSWYMRPSIIEIIEAFETAYARSSDEVEEMARNARAFAIDYDADVVFEDYWKPALESLERPVEVGPLVPAPNRAMRRAAARSKA